MLSNRVLALQQQQQHQSHFAPAPYAAPYYPNYMPHPPPPMSSHPPPPMPPTVQPQQAFPMRPPAMSTAIANANPLFAASSATGIPASSSAPSTAAPFFQFSSAATVPPTSTSSFTQARTSTAPAPTNTTPTKTPFSGAPVFGTAEINVKPAPAANNKPATSSTTTSDTSRS